MTNEAPDREKLTERALDILRRMGTTLDHSAPEVYALQNEIDLADGKTPRHPKQAADALRASASPAILAAHAPSGGFAAPVLSVAEDAVIEERRRQVIKEGWTAEHDDNHPRGEMALAAASYCLWSFYDTDINKIGRQVWPWDDSWFKPKDFRRDLVRAAALIIAEIERHDRALSQPSGEEK